MAPRGVLENIKSENNILHEAEGNILFRGFYIFQFAEGSMQYLFYHNENPFHRATPTICLKEKVYRLSLPLKNKTKHCY